MSARGSQPSSKKEKLPEHDTVKKRSTLKRPAASRRRRGTKPTGSQLGRETRDGRNKSSVMASAINHFLP